MFDVWVSDSTMPLFTGMTQAAAEQHAIDLALLNEEGDTFSSMPESASRKLFRGLRKQLGDSPYQIRRMANVIWNS